MNLNIGASKSYLPGFVNIDAVPHSDLQLNLEVDDLPFDDNSVDVVFSYHTIEHIQNYLGLLAEIHRVLKPRGRLFIGVPYVTLTEYNLINPYHRQHFNEFSFDFFDPKKLLGSAAEDGAITFRKVFHRFHYMPEFELKSDRRKEWCRRHLFNVVRKIDFGLLALKDETDDVKVDEQMEAQFVREFDEILRQRKRYR